MALASLAMASPSLRAVPLAILLLLTAGAKAQPVAQKHAATKPQPGPIVPAAPPPAPIIAPPDAAPPHPTAPPPPPVIHDDAPGQASKITNGLRLTFGPGHTDLNPATAAALRILSHTGAASSEVIFNLYAHAPGDPDDSSTPRRLSLARALTVRSALINGGIASTRIYVHAMGQSGASLGPPDRVDITMATLDGPAASPANPVLPSSPALSSHDGATP